MKNNLNSRRKFIANTGKAVLALGFSNSVLTGFTKNMSLNSTDLFTQKPLEYAFDALNVAIDAQTMEIHYTKHAAGYCKNVNEAFVAEVRESNISLESILNNISKYSIKMRNNAGGHFNHEMFWQCLTPKSSKDSSEVLFKKINENFNSFEAFQKEFNDAAKTRFGSGWAWLIQTKEGKLKITSTPNQDNPLMDISEVKGKPILCLDVWEHAYYLRYQNKRADYINNFWNVLNWDFASKQLV